MAQYIKFGKTLIRPEHVSFVTPASGGRIEIGLIWNKVVRLDGDDAKAALRWLADLPEGAFARADGDWD